VIAASLLPFNADLNTRVTMCNDPSLVVCFFDTGGAVPHFAMYTAVLKFFIAALSRRRSMVQLRTVCLPLMLTSFILWHHPIHPMALLSLNEPLLAASLIEICDMHSQVLRSMRTLPFFLVLSAFELWYCVRSWSAYDDIFRLFLGFLSPCPTATQH
jgi:hypothetical protein